MSDSTLAKDFYTEFQAIRDGQFEVLLRDRARDFCRVARLTQILDFTTRLSTATSLHVSELSAQLAVLRKQLVDARSFLPPYDQRQYDMVPNSLDALDVITDDIPGVKQLKSWEQALGKLQTNQSSTGTKPKFAFKRKEKSKAPTSDPPEVKASIPAETINRLPASHLSLTSKSGCLLTFTSLPGASSIPIDSELIITNLSSCIVDLMKSDRTALAPTAVHVGNLTSCVLLLPVIKGSVLLRDIQRCVVVIPGCHQVLHEPLSALGLLSGHPPPSLPGL